jgi:hypothetical protein
MFKTQTFSPVAISIFTTLSITLISELFLKSLNNEFNGILVSMIGEKTFPTLLKLIS